MPRKAGRPRAGEEPLTRERIVQTAIALVDREGIEALTMRRLATNLGVDPMAVYHHLPNKRALLSAVITEVFADLRTELDALDHATADWQARVASWARAFLDVARRHPKLVPQLAADPGAAAEATLEATEDLFAALEASGMSPRLVFAAAGVIVDYVNGFALAAASGAVGDPAEHREFAALLAGRPPDQLRAMRRTLAALTEADLATDFEFGLDVLLTGLDAIRNRPSG